MSDEGSILGAIGGFMTDDGPAEYSMLAPRPAGTDFDDNASVRWTARNEEGRTRMMDAGGGREVTEIEQIDQKIEFWREQGSEEMIPDLEARRARLVAEGDRGEP